MTNVIQFKRSNDAAEPLETFKELHVLYDKLRHLNAEVKRLEHRLGPDIQPLERNTAARHAVHQTSSLISRAADELLEAIADLIVETTASAIVPPARNQDQPNSG